MSSSIAPEDNSCRLLARYVVGNDGGLAFFTLFVWAWGVGALTQFLMAWGKHIGTVAGAVCVFTIYYCWRMAIVWRLRMRVEIWSDSLRWRSYDWVWRGIHCDRIAFADIVRIGPVSPMVAFVRLQDGREVEAPGYMFMSLEYCDDSVSESAQRLSTYDLLRVIRPELF